MDLGIPELSGRNRQLIRIPPELDVVVTPRVVSLLNTPAMQRLKRISQLGLVSHVYPGAVHSRFEHSLGVYRLARISLKHILNAEPGFADRVSANDVRVFLISALLHDVGHWPYCHLIEDLRLAEFPRHEALARSLICSHPMASIISDQWQVEPEQVADFISPPSGHATCSVLKNLLNGPVDIDKMDYLQRDSLHAGVPYGRNFDIGRLISSLCIGSDGASIAITEKGKTASEMMVFARYIMFSEVYWHHTVRSATAMLQRLVYFLRQRCRVEDWLTHSDASFAVQLLEQSASIPDAIDLANSLFGHRRELFKRLAQYTFSESPEVFASLARRPYPQLVQIAELLGQRLSRRLSTPLNATDILIDAPPVKLEVQFKIDVKRHHAIHPALRFSPLSDVSPVVRSLATDQFDNFVKRIRVFVSPHRAQELQFVQSEMTDELLAIANHLEDVAETSTATSPKE